MGCFLLLQLISDNRSYKVEQTGQPCQPHCHAGLVTEIQVQKVRQVCLTGLCLMPYLDESSTNTKLTPASNDGLVPRTSRDAFLDDIMSCGDAL